MSDSMIPERGWIRRYVDLWTPQSEAPATAHLAAALAVLSAAVGWRARVRWGDSEEPCCLYVLIEGGSAVAKKTTTARTAASIVRRAVRELTQERPPLGVVSIQHTSQRGLIELVGTGDQELADRWEREPPPGLLLDWDEFGAVLGRPGDVKGADWLGQVRTTLMGMYSGRHGGIHTGGSKVAPSRCAVAVLATMTRVELEQRVSLGVLRDGFLGRFILIPHAGRRAWLSEPPEWTSLDAQERDRLALWLSKLVSSQHEIGNVFRRQTPAAKQVRDDWYRKRGEEMDALAASGAEAGRAVSDVFGRLQATAVKLAAVLAVSEWDPDAEILEEVRIEERHVRYGQALADYALEEIKALALEGHGTPADRYTRVVETYLNRRNGHGPPTRKHVLDACEMEGMTRAQRWAVIEGMANDGIVEITRHKTPGRPRVEVTLL